jgi:hypothetical protein
VKLHDNAFLCTHIEKVYFLSYGLDATAHLGAGAIVTEQFCCEKA